METYKYLVRSFKKGFPEIKASIRRVKMPAGFDGDCCQNEDKHFTIRINKNLSENLAIETLIHEFAHAVAWNKCNKELHSNEWGKAYSKVYRYFLKVACEE